MVVPSLPFSFAMQWYWNHYVRRHRVALSAHYFGEPLSKPRPNGIPISLGLAPGSGSIGGINNVQFVLTYNPAMLTILGADTVTSLGSVAGTASPHFAMTGNDSVMPELVKSRS